MQLDSTAAIVTGGASGLGAATVRALAAQGVAVFALDREVDGGRCRRRRDLRRHRRHRPRPGAGGRRPGRLGRRARCARSSTAPGSARRCGSWARRVCTTSTPTRSVIKVNLIGTFNVLALASEKIAATEPLEDGTARRHREHRVDRGLRRPGRPGGVRLVQGRDRRPHPARRPRPGAVRHPGQHDRARHRGDPDAGHGLRGVPRRPRRRSPVPAASRRVPRSSPSSRWRSSTTTTSTARSSGWTAPCGWRPASGAG